VVEQTLGNWVKAHRAGTLKGCSSKPQVTAEQNYVSPMQFEQDWTDATVKIAA
jgi:hypothetical protein